MLNQAVIQSTETEAKKIAEFWHDVFQEGAIESICEIVEELLTNNKLTPQRRMDLVEVIEDELKVIKQTLFN